MKKIARLIVALCLAFVVATPAFAPAVSYAASNAKVIKVSKAKPATKSKKISRAAKAKRQQAPADRFSALVVDASTGRVLYEKNASRTRYPASLTKMMTLYLTFDALKKGRLGLDDPLYISAKASKQPQTNISLEEGDRLSVKTAIESVVIRSANDSAMALAETIGGTQWNFALMMTKKARQLGMKNTVFRNPNGLPDNQQHTTAYDMARLGIALRRDFPEYYGYFKRREFTYGGVTYQTHNHVLERYDGADGIKTGYIRASGFNLVTSVKRGKYNIVAVIMGGNTANSRDNQMVALLDRTFAQLESKNRGVAKRVDLEDSEHKTALLLMPPVGEGN